MDVNMRVAVSFVTIAAWTLLGADGNHTFNIETILANSCYSDTECDKTPRDINFTATEHGFHVTLSVSWFSSSNVFQLYSYVKSADRRHANLLLIDEKLTRLSALPSPTPDFPYVILPEVFWLHEEQPEPEPDDECCEGFLSLEEVDSEPPEVDVNKCLGWADPAEGLVAVIQHLKWKNAFVIYDEMNEQEAADVIANIDNCQFVMSLIENTNSPSTESESAASLPNSNQYKQTVSKNRQEGDEPDIRSLLSSIHDNTSPDVSIHIVVLCSLINIKRIMSVANTFDKERNRNSSLFFRSRWLLALPTDRAVDDELSSFLEDMDHLDNVAVVDSRYTQYKQDQMNISIKLQELMQEFMSRATQVENKTCMLQLSSVMMQILQSANNRCTDIQVNTLYFGGLKGRYLSTVAMVHNTQGVVLRGSNDVFPNTLFALNNRTLKISTVHWIPFVNKTENGYDGLCIDMLKQMETVMNFTAQLVTPTDGEWGRLVQSNALFTGLVGQLQRQEVDMVVAPLAMDVERGRVIDFAFPFYTDYTTVVYKRRDPRGSKWLTLIQPFKWQVHVTIWISLFSVAILITILERQNPYYQAKSQKSAFYNFIDSIWYMYGSLLTQGGEDLPTSTTGLTLVSFWLMFSVIVASTYSGNLIAFLTVNLDPLPIDSLQRMLGQDRYKYGTIGDTANEPMFGFQSQEQLLKTSHDPVKQDIWDHIKRFNRSDPSVLSFNIDQHRKKVDMGDYAFIGDLSRIDMWINADCELRTIKDNFFPVQYAVGLIKNSPYRLLVSKAMIDMSDLGLFQKWSTRKWPKIETCQGKLFTEATAISVLEVQSAFYMLIVGIAVSLLILGAEKLKQYHSTRRGRRRYSFRNAAGSDNNKAELTLNDSVEKTRDSYEMTDRFSNIAVPSTADNVLGDVTGKTFRNHVYTLDNSSRGFNEGNPLNPVDFSCADSWDSGFDDHLQRQKPYVFKDKVPFYLARISLPKFLGRNRSTSL